MWKNKKGVSVALLSDMRRMFVRGDFRESILLKKKSKKKVKKKKQHLNNKDLYSSFCSECFSFISNHLRYSKTFFPGILFIIGFNQNKSLPVEKKKQETQSLFITQRTNLNMHKNIFQLLLIVCFTWEKWRNMSKKY